MNYNKRQSHYVYGKTYFTTNYSTTNKHDNKKRQFNGQEKIEHSSVTHSSNLLQNLSKKPFCNKIATLSEARFLSSMTVHIFLFFI